MGKEPEEAEEEGQWKGRERTMTKGRRIGRDDDDENDYAPPHPESEAAAASSDSELVIPFAFGGKEAVETAVGYTELTFAVFDRGYLLVLVHWCRYRRKCGRLGDG